MKKIFLILAVVLPLSAAAKAPVKQVTTPANDSHITYVARTAVAEDGSVSFDWSGSTVRVAFDGDYLAVKVSDTKKNYYNVWIDKDPVAEADQVIATFGKDSLIVLADKAGKGVHRITLQKRTEGEQGTTTIHSFISNGPLLQAEGLKERQIEVIGDSYSCGYGSENSVAKDPFKPETENVNKAYEEIIARYFDADIMVIAHSGMGITRNYNEEMKPALYGYHMVERYTQTFDENKEIKWDASKCAFKPAITIIYLGANDFSVNKQPSLQSFKKKYNTLLKEIKDNYGEDHPVLCCATRNNPQILDYVREVALTCGLKNVRYAAIFDGLFYLDDRELGASSHPNYKAHVKTAYALLPYVATSTGWEITEKAVK